MAARRCDLSGTGTMALASEVSFLRRFAGKFVEIVAAGIGTAVSGYLVASIAGHFSWSMPSTVAPAPSQTSAWSAAPPGNASIEATVRAALASHDGRDAAPIVATTAQPPAPASPETTVSVPAVAPPLAAAEVKSLPVAADADPALPAEPDAWPSDRAPESGSGRSSVAHSLGMLPPQPPPVNGDLLTALKRLF